MARPQKDGIDYFPFDVGLLRDPKFRDVKLNHGNVAVYIYLSLLSLLYRDKGYYIDYSSDKAKKDVIWEIFCDLMGKYQPTQETIEGVIEDLVACELFSGDQFTSGIITSIRSQETYYSATVERKMVNIKENIWLLSLEDMKKLSVKHCYYLFCLNRPNNEVNRPNNEVNRPNNPQSKVKESKVKYSKEKESKPNGCLSLLEKLVLDTDLKNLYSKYLNMRKSIDSPLENEGLRMLIDRVNELEPTDIGRQKKMIEAAIIGNWKNVYPLKPEENQKVGYDVYTDNFDHDNLGELTKKNYD